MKNDGRPGALSTTHGRKVIALMVLGLFAAYLFLTVSNKITGQGGGAEAAQQDQAVVSSESPLPSGVTTEVGPDGTTRTARAPAISPAVPDVFNPGAQAVGESSSTSYATDDPSSPTVVTGSAVPTGDAQWQEAQKVAVLAAEGYCKWSYEQDPKVYVDGIPGLAADFRKNMESAASESWAQIKRAKASATCSDAVDQPVLADSFDSKKNVAVMNMRKSQQVTSNGEKVRRVASFEVTVAKKGDDWQVVNIRS